METAIKKIKDLNTKYLVLSFGVDPADGDPICTFHLTYADFKDIGVRLKSIGNARPFVLELVIVDSPLTILLCLKASQLIWKGLPILVVQEGGYSEDEILGTSAKSLLEGLAGL